MPAAPPLIDAFGRVVSSLRLSVTDRCDMRCVYCIGGGTRFVPRAGILTLEELERLVRVFMGFGVRRVRITGGEPLLRRGVMRLFRAVSRHLVAGLLDELTLTTNGSQLARYAAELAECGVRRVNVSLDSLDPDRYRAITRGGSLAAVLNGIDAAQNAGLAVKINTVALKGLNETDIAGLLRFAHGRGMALTVIEVMPMGDIDVDRAAQFVPMAAIRERLCREFTLEPVAETSGGPARWVRVTETGGKLGFISPISARFCAGCDRVRVTCSGLLHPCLGRDFAVDLRAPLRQFPGDDAPTSAAIRRAVLLKPHGHAFSADALNRIQVTRPMNVTGG